MIRRALTSQVALLLAACSTLPAPSTDGPAPVWPPAAVDSPAEVVWLRAVDRLQWGARGQWLRALAGEPTRDGTWPLPRPVAVAVAGERLFAVDTAMGEVLTADLQGRGARRLDLPAGFVPVAVVASADGSGVLVADRASGAVASFHRDGGFRGLAVEPGAVRQCGGLAVTGAGEIVLTDAAEGSVVLLSPSGELLRRSGSRGAEPGQFNFPGAVAEAPDGTLWVLDGLNFRLQQLDRQLRPIGGFGTHGDGTGQFALPKGLAVDADGHLWVSDARFDVIQVFDETGRLLLVVGGRGGGRGEFWNPAGLAFDDTGRLLVADTGNQRLQVFQYRRRLNG